MYLKFVRVGVSLLGVALVFATAITVSGVSMEDDQEVSASEDSIAAGLEKVSALGNLAGSDWLNTLKKKASDALEVGKEKAPEVIEKSKELASATKEKAGELYEVAKERAPGVIDHAKESLAIAGGKVQQFQDDQRNQFWRWVDDQIDGTSAAASQDDSQNETEPSE